MSQANLQVTPRDDKGRRVARRLRREGQIPGVYYHHGHAAKGLAVNTKAFSQVVASESNIIQLDFGDGKALPTIVREIQWDPVSSAPLHVDFLGIKLDEKVTVETSLHLVGTPEGVKNEGGILQFILRQIEIECLPMDIPEHLEVDVSALNINDSVKVSELDLENVEILTDPDSVIASVLPPRLEEEVEEEVEDEDGEAEPEVVGEEKEEEEGGE